MNFILGQTMQRDGEGNINKKCLTTTIVNDIARSDLCNCSYGRGLDTAVSSQKACWYWHPDITYLVSVWFTRVDVRVGRNTKSTSVG